MPKWFLAGPVAEQVGQEIARSRQDLRKLVCVVMATQALTLLSEILRWVVR